MHLRRATESDLAAINDIYNHYVPTSTCTYQLEPETMAARRAWFASHGNDHPIIVAEVEGRIVGWASLSPWNSRCGYRGTVEDSVYIHHQHHGKGIGSALLAEIIRLARELGYHTIIAGADSEQTASIALHAKFGFVQVSHFKQTGFKFGRWLDVKHFQRMLS